MAVGDSDVFEADGVAIPSNTRPTKLYFITIQAPEGSAMELTVRENTVGGRRRWKGNAQAGTTQQFAFPKNMVMAADVYLQASAWGVVTLGWQQE